MLEKNDWEYIEDISFKNFGCIMRRQESLETTLVLWKIKGNRKRGQQKTGRFYIFMNYSRTLRISYQQTIPVMSIGSQRVKNHCTTATNLQQKNNNTKNKQPCSVCSLLDYLKFILSIMVAVIVIVITILLHLFQNVVYQPCYIWEILFCWMTRISVAPTAAFYAPSYWIFALLFCGHLSYIHGTIKILLNSIDWTHLPCCLLSPIRQNGKDFPNYAFILH